jgi:phage gp16-like protein
MSAPDPRRKAELALIHMGKAFCKLSQDDYEFMIREVTQTNKTSAADLTPGERDKLIQHFKTKGFQIKPSGRAKSVSKPAPDDKPQIRKMRAIWWALADVGAVERPAGAGGCAAAVEAWALRQASKGALGAFSALRFADPFQLNKLIEELKSWGERVGARVL